MRIVLPGGLILLILVGVCLGGGFELYEFGARSSSLGGAVVAQAFDASTVFYNPAGIGFIKGTQFYGGVTLIAASNRWVSPKLANGQSLYGTDEVFDSKDRIHTPIGIYFSHSFTDKLAAGIGVTNPFGLGLEWDDDFPGRFISKNVDLKSFYVSPVLAYQVSPNLSIGGGPDIVYSTVKLERAILASAGPPATDPGTEVGELSMEADSKIGFGFSAGMQYRYDKLSLGFLYRHQVKNEFEDGDADFTLFEEFKMLLEEQKGLVDQEGSTEITYPGFFSVGAHYQLLPRFGVELDFMWNNWSVFDKLELTFDKLGTEIVEEKYEDSYQFRLGLNYDLQENLELRAGYIYDKTPQPIESVSPLLPDNNRNDFALGLGYIMNSLKFDVGYMAVLFGQRSTIEDGIGKQFDGFDGEYSSIAHLFFFSLGIDIKPVQ